MKYDEYGRELPDDTPVEIPIKFKRPPSIQELIAMHVKSAMQVERAMGKNEDEEDFEEEQEMDDVLTPYELHAYAGEADAELRRAKVADELVRRARKGKVDEKGTGRSSEVGKEKSKEVGGVGPDGKEGSGSKGAGSKALGDDPGGKEGVA